MTAEIDKADLIDQFIVTRSPAVREELVLRYVSLVHYVLGRLGVSQEIGSEYEDLVNQGMLGLIEAVDRYDPGYGAQFSTYATVRIRGKILDYLRSLDWLSRTARTRTKAIQRAIVELSEKSQHAPTEEEIAQHLNIDVSKVQQGLTDSSRVLLSLDAVLEIDESGGISKYETLADENQLDPADVVTEQDLMEQTILLLKQLPEREQQVLSLYYCEGLTLKEIGCVLGVSESRICQLHARAVLSLRALLSSSNGRNLPPADCDQPAAAQVHYPARVRGFTGAPQSEATHA